MSIYHPNIVGTSQSERKKSILLPKAHLVNIKEYTHFLIFSYLYSDILKPYKKENHWSEFFENDDIFIYAFILHTNISKFEKIIHANIVDLKQSDDIYNWDSFLKKLTLLFTDYLLLTFSWYQKLSNGDIVKNKLIQCFIDLFSPKLHILYSVISVLNKNNYQEYYQKFLNIVEKGYKKYKISLNKIDDFPNFDYKKFNNYVFDAFRDFAELILVQLNNLQKLVENNFNNTLYNFSHNPHITLLLAFIKILEHINVRFFNVVNRHLDYYYNGVLMFKNKEEIKDKALVFCLCDQNDVVKTVPKSTKIYGGKDSNDQDIFFQTDEEAQISGLKIKTIKTILRSEFFINNIDNFPNTYIEIATYDMMEVLSKNQKLYLFSKKFSNASLLSKTKNIKHFSFIFSSYIFKLKEGERNISIKFYPTKVSLKILLQTLKKLHLFIGDENKTLDVFANVLSKAVLFRYTTTEDLFYIDKNNVFMQWLEKEEAFVVNIKFSSDMPSFSFNEIDLLQIEDNNPCLQMIYTNESLLWSSVLFYNLKFSSIKISVDVKNCKNLILQNDFGLIENNLSFEPFGPIPKIGSNFFIGSEEIFNKKLVSLTLNIEWDSLPESFEKYYKNYGVNFRNSDFKANVAFLQQGYWYPLDKNLQQGINLFDIIESNNSNILKKTKTINNIDLSLLQLNRKHNFDFSTPFLYSETVGGFLRIQLCNPSVAFAHSIYPQKLTQNLTLSKNKIFGKAVDYIEINEPYTPKIKVFNIDYKAEEEIDYTNYLDNDKISIIKTYPFGYKKMQLFSEEELVDFFYQVRLLTENAYTAVNIELSKIFTPTFTLYVYIDEVSILQNSTTDKPIWRYLSDNQWVVFDSDFIIFDSTDNLKKSGFIKFKTPKIIHTKNTICESSIGESDWIQILFIRPKKYLPTIIGIFTEVIKVTRISNNTQNKLLAGELKEFNDPNLKNVKIFQPFNSFGGKNEETKEEMYIRISERLNHKGRAVTVKDYERIILEKFPEVIVAKCLKHTCSNDIKAISPGYVTIVVIINNTLKIENNRRFPQASIEFLNIIKKEVQKYSSPFVQIDVINPVFEEIKFIFKVRMQNPKQNDVLVKKLNSELKIFISPWLYFNFNRTFNSTQIKALDVIRFIKSKDYVKNISNFVILRTYKNETTVFKKNNDQVRTSFPHSFFYSANTHNIIVDDILECKDNELELNNMNIEQDFIVGPVFQSENKQNEKCQDNFPESVDGYYMYLKK